MDEKLIIAADTLTARPRPPCSRSPCDCPSVSDRWSRACGTKQSTVREIKREKLHVFKYFVCVCECAPPLHALHQRHLVWRWGDVEGGGFALVDAMFDPVHRLLLLHLHRVAQTQRPEKQLLVLLQPTTNTGLYTEPSGRWCRRYLYSNIRL